MPEITNYSDPQYRIHDGEDGVIIGRTEKMLDVFQYLNHLASLPTTVLLRGETGTGKELCAKALHFNGNSKRRNYEFVAVNCAGIPSELLESELFGYVRGAFTGAYRETTGKFQHADNGTILLDEIGDMSPALQAKVLRVLQEKKVTKVGSNEVHPINIRVVAATNRDLEEEVKKRNFREDLYYRLNVVPIKIPSLGERREDIPLIAEYFIQRHNGRYDCNIEGLSEEAKEKLGSAEWTGNVRELENVIERVFVLKRGGMVSAEDLFFNSDMPTKIELKFLESSGFGRTEKKWYEEGVLPIGQSLLSRLEGSKSYHKIREIAANGRIYSEAVHPKRHLHVIYLTPDNLELFFEDTSTEDYRDLESRILEGDFNGIVQKPFALFSASDLSADPNVFNSSKHIDRAIKESGIYQVALSIGKGFVLTLDNFHHFIPWSGAKRRPRLINMRERILKAYERFKTWEPE